MRQFFNAIRAHITSVYKEHKFLANSAQGSLAFGAAIGAFFVGDDLISVVIALLVAWIFACFSILGQERFTNRSKIGWASAALFVFCVEGSYVFSHHKKDVSSGDIMEAVKSIQKNNSFQSGDLNPETSKEDGPCYILNKRLHLVPMTDVEIGTASYGTAAFPYAAIKVDDDPFLTIEKDGLGRLSATFDVYSGNGFIEAEVKRIMFLSPLHLIHTLITE